MPKSSGDQKLAFVFSGQLHRHPFFIGGGTFSQIYRYIQHRAASAAHQFRLGGVPFLKMDAPKRSFLGGIGLIVLHKVIVQPGLFHIAGGPGFHKPATMIAEYFRLQDVDV